LAARKTEGSFVAEFIQQHCRLTRGDRAGQLVRLEPFQRELLDDLFELRAGTRRYRRAYVQLPRKNGKTFLLACVSLYEALTGEIGGEVYFVAGDRQQASRAFDECRRIVDQDVELAGLFTAYRHSMEVPSTGTILRVLSAEAGLQQGLSPSFVVFDEVAVQPNDRLWNVMSLGSGARSQPMIVGISTPGWEKNSFAYRLYAHGKKVLAGEVEDPTFFFRCFEPADPEADHIDPAVWRESNPGLGAFLHEADFAAAIASTEEAEFRRFRLGQWTSTRSVALPAGAWDDCAVQLEVKAGESAVVAFVASRARDCIALVGCTLEGFVFPIEIFEPGERVDPVNVAAAIRECFGRYDVRELTCQEHDWTWVLLEMESEDLPVVKMPLSPQRSAKAWQVFADAILEQRLTQSGDPALARHVGNLTLRSDRSGVRPDLELASAGAYINGAVAAMIAYERATEIASQPVREPMIAFI
jgi:phage terminase large subunit-like protein